MKRPTMLVQAMLRQLSIDLDLSVERDQQRIADRCKHEGLSFLTITLPQLSDALERGLEAGTFTCPSSFSRHGSLPRFMGGFFKRVFHTDGRLLDEPCPYTIAGIRQVCRFFKKLKLGCSDKRNLIAEQHFIDVEGDLRMMTPSVERKDNFLDKISGILWSQVFPELSYLDLVCHHGPGVTADRYASNQRYRITKWNHRSELTFPSDLHCYSNYGIAARFGGTGEGIGCNEGVKYLDVKDESPVRVVFVPKTQTSPRVIAIEPSHMQYMQQSVKDYVYKVIEGHPLTKRSIRFSRQDVNQRLAYKASKDRRLATLDLKDASDRVHLHLVQRIFKTSGLLEYLEDARSLHADLPTGKNIVLFKYASMGSALCFPVEAMVFYTLIQTALHVATGTRPTSSSIFHFSGMIDIYGDDIIVPIEYADVVVETLESYALKVNVSKSFKEGNFRESCGGDYFKGEWVTPIYAREIPHDDPRDWTPETYMSWAAASDLFYMRGLWKVAQAIRDMVSSVARRHIPRSTIHGSGLYFFSYLFSTNLHYNSSLHCWKQKRIEYVPLKRKDSIDGDEIACLNHWGLSGAVSARGGYGKGFIPYLQHTSGSGRGSDSSNSPIQSPDWMHLGTVCEDGFPRLGSSIGTPDILFGVPGEIPESGQEATETRSPWTDVDYCLIQARARDPHYFLTGREEGLDFLSSTKRGCFKSKSRWVNLAG